ncbi:hypothetical protein [Sorangium sp. So ce1389]|uniref:hypothetical protein n=1 Tax=Sorangium sp. So ce1389 TaxID=3133336 RepID=UPI003F616C2C
MRAKTANMRNAAERIVVTNPSQQRFRGAAEHARIVMFYQAADLRRARRWCAAARLVLREHHAHSRERLRRGGVVTCGVIEANPETCVKLIHAAGITVQEHVDSAIAS